MTKLPTNKTIGKIGLLSFWIPIVLTIIAISLAANAYDADIMFSVTISSPDIESTTTEITPMWIMFLLPMLYSAYAIVFTMMWCDDEIENGKWSIIYKFVGLLLLSCIIEGIIQGIMLMIDVSMW